MIDQPRFLEAYQLWLSHDLANYCPDFYQHLNPKDRGLIWQFIEQHYLSRYRLFIGLRFEWSSDGLWSIPFPGSVSYGTCLSVDCLDEDCTCQGECVALPEAISNAVFAWHLPLDMRSVYEDEDNDDGFDYAVSDALGLEAAKQVKAFLGDDWYVEFKPFQEIKLIDGEAVEMPIPSFIVTISNWDYAIEQAVAGNFDEITRLVNAGFDFNLIHPRTQEVWLDEYFSCVYFDDNQTVKCEMLKHIIALGCDPNVMVEESCALIIPMFREDEVVLQILLEAGADPNKAAGLSADESFYDWALFDYYYNEWLTSNDLISIDPTEEEKASEEGRLDFYERAAKADGKKPPTHLRVLRAFGAKTREEQIQEGSHV